MTSRHVRTAVTMMVLGLFLLLAVIWGWKSLFEPLPTSDSQAVPDSQCSGPTAQVGDRIKAAEVQVSVFNGGGTSGLAGRTLAALESRGFKAGKAGNAPEDAGVKYAQVWTTRKHDAEARLVRRQLGAKARVHVVDTDLGPGIDVVVGKDFRGLAKASTSLKVRSEQQVCD